MGAIELSYQRHGPLLDGSAPQLFTELAAELTDSLGQFAIEFIHRLMDRSFVNPTPYYETQVVLERLGDVLVMHDRGIIYGPWLEGVSRRNATSRFKGYALWRRTTQEVETAIPQKMAEVWERNRGRFDG